MNPISISILIPTLGRPQRLRDCIASIYDTAADPGAVEVLARVDSADPARVEYIKMFDGVCGACRAFYVTGQGSYGRGIEFLRGHARGEILCAGADDVQFRTQGWDDLVRAAFAARPDGLLVAYANNGLGREKCEHFFTSKRWIALLGYMVRTEFRHFCVDAWVEELARGAGRLVFLREVVIEHLHKKYAKAPDDATYRLVRGDTRTSEADNALYAQLADLRAEDLALLRGAVGG